MSLPAWILTTNPRSFEKERELRGEKKKKRYFCLTTVTYPQRNPSSHIPNGNLPFHKITTAKQKAAGSLLSVSILCGTT